MIVLAWPDKRLSPNARVHHMALYRAKAKAKDDAWGATREVFSAAARKRFAGDAPIPLTVTFYPPDKRRRDEDNAISSLKAALDGIALALGVDDHRFRPVWVHAEPCKPGRVEVVL